MYLVLVELDFRYEVQGTAIKSSPNWPQLKVISHQVFPQHIILLSDRIFSSNRGFGKLKRGRSPEWPADYANTPVPLWD